MEELYLENEEIMDSREFPEWVYMEMEVSL